MYQVIIAMGFYEVVHIVNRNTIAVRDSMLGAIAECRRANIDARASGAERVPMGLRLQA